MKRSSSAAAAAFVRLWIFLLAAVVVGCVWATALAAESGAGPGGTNTLSDTNAPATRTRKLAEAFTSREFFNSHRSALSFGLDRVPALQAELFGNPLWQYLASLIYVVLAFSVSHFVDWLVQTRLRHWALQTATQWDDVLVNLVAGPVKVVTFVLLLHVGLQIFEWPGWIEHYLSRLTLIVVALSVVYVLMKAVDAVVGVWKARLPNEGDRAFNEQFLIVLGKLAKAVIVVVAFLTVLSNFGINITALLGSVSVLGLALGLAAQDTVSNLFGAVAVFVDKPFKLGDRIQVGGVEGMVEEMGLRATRVRSLDGFLITVPNKTVGNNTVINVTDRPTIKTELNYGITYDVPAARVRRAVAILEEIFRAHPMTHDVIVSFNRMLDSSLNLQVLHWWKNGDLRANGAGIQELNLAVLERFAAEGIDFAFPTRTVLLRQEAPVQTPRP